MKSIRRLILLCVSTMLVMSSITPQAWARPAKPTKPAASADLEIAGITESEDPILFTEIYDDREFYYELNFLNHGPSNGSGTVDIRLTGGRVEYAYSGRYVAEYDRSGWITGYYWSPDACSLLSETEVHCDLALIPTNATSWHGLTLRVQPNAFTLESLPAEMTISADLRGNQPDPDLTNNFRSESTTVVPWVGVRLPIPPMPDPCLYC